ncbi:MAG: PHP domain-containing protein [Oscillospiraceae bacterium]|nr:PHP domain-containing protein [Oscillospiraceae bacterium]
MIDLHIHSEKSDGKNSVQEILAKYEERKVKIISITDHDTCLAYDELEQKNVRETYKGKIIIGCEMTAVLQCNSDVHILGYDMNINMVKNNLSKLYAPFKTRNIYAATVLLDKCKELGMTFDKEQIKFDVNKEHAVYSIYNELMKHEENKRQIDEKNWGNVSSFIYNCIKNPQSRFFINLEGYIPNLDEVSQFIRDSKGKVFIAHFYQYDQKTKMELIKAIHEGKIDGLECFNPSHTQEQQEKLIETCRKNNLFISGGSDYHGKANEGIQIGVSMPVELIKKWSRKDKEFDR